jgi:DNA-binding CsgD family transcriptional regulator
MLSGGAARRVRSEYAAAAVPEDVLAQVHALVGLVLERGMSFQGRVLLDVEVEGVRCVLERAPVTPTTVALSPRQEEIALLVAEGRTNRSIARSLGISEWTVNSHLRRIYEKLSVRSRAEMVAKVLGLGLHVSATG